MNSTLKADGRCKQAIPSTQKYNLGASLVPRTTQANTVNTKKEKNQLLSSDCIKHST